MSNKIKHLTELKNSLSIEGKKKLILGLKRWKEKLAKENSMTLSPQEPMWVSEEIPNKERNVIAKTFTINGDFNQYVNRNRGVQFTSKEMDSISNFKSNVTPTFQDKFSIKFETTDDFGNNTTCIIKKHLQGNQFVFTAYTSHDKARPEPKPESKPIQKPTLPSTKKISPPVKGTSPLSTSKPTNKPTPSSPLKEENNMNNQIEVTKTITFQNDNQGADILADFLRKIDL